MSKRGGFIGGPGPREYLTPKKNLIELFNSFVSAIAFGLGWIVLAWGYVGLCWLNNSQGKFVLWVFEHLRQWWIVALLGLVWALIDFLYVVRTGTYDPYYEPGNWGELARVLPLTPLVRLVRGGFSLIEAIVRLGHKEPNPDIHVDVEYDDGIRAGRKTP